MKRSTSLKLVVMTSAAAMSLASCSDNQSQSSQAEPKGHLYASVSDCIAGNVYTSDMCEKTFAASDKLAEKEAPRFDEASECEQNYNNCEPRDRDGQTYYSPSPVGSFVTGMLIGNILSSNAGPVYRDRSGKQSYASGRSFSAPSSNKAVKPRAQTRTSAASRGGFGSRSRFGSFGG